MKEETKGLGTQERHCNRARPSHCRDPGKQCPVTGPPPLAGHDSQAIYPWLHEPLFFLGWALLLFCPGPGTSHQPWGSVSLLLNPLCLALHCCLLLPLAWGRMISVGAEQTISLIHMGQWALTFEASRPWSWLPLLRTVRVARFQSCLALLHWSAASDATCCLSRVGSERDHCWYCLGLWSGPPFLGGKPPDCRPEC